MEQDLASAKKSLRSSMKNRLQTLAFDRNDAAEKLYRNLMSLSQVRNATTVAVFIDFGEEVRSRRFIPRLFDGHGFSRTIGIPFCLGVEMRFYKLSRPIVDPETGEPSFPDLIPAKYGILEPRPELRDVSENIVNPEDIDVILTPGLAFDLHGGRLGRGAGYYDRFLPKTRPNATVIGVCYDEQIVLKTPTDDRDFRVHAVATPERVVLFK